MFYWTGKTEPPNGWIFRTAVSEVGGAAPYIPPYGTGGGGKEKITEQGQQREGKSELDTVTVLNLQLQLLKPFIMWGKSKLYIVLLDSKKKGRDKGHGVGYTRIQGVKGDYMRLWWNHCSISFSNTW